MSDNPEQSFTLEVSTDSDSVQTVAGETRVKLVLTCNLYRAQVNEITALAEKGRDGKTARVLGFQPREMLLDEHRTFTVALPEGVTEIGVLVQAGSATRAGTSNYHFFWRSQTVHI